MPTPSASRFSPSGSSPRSSASCSRGRRRSRRDPVSARLLDGNAVAAAIREAVAPGRPAFHGSGRSSARAWHRPRRRGSRLGDLRPQQGQGRQRDRACGSICSACRRRRASTTPGARRAPQRQRRARRHPGAVAAAGRRWESTPRSACSTPSIRRRTSTGFIPATSGGSSRAAPHLVPCTPSGVIEMLDRDGIAIAGTRAVVIGRSEIVGKPMALLLLQRDATVTICHSRTADLPAVAREADILVAALGRAGFVTPAFVKPGATVIDVGINRVTDPAVGERLFRAGFDAAGRLRAPRVGRRRRRPSGGGRRGRRADAGAWRRRTAHHRGAPEEHRQGRERAHISGLTMRRVALTGGIATGKSYCLARFAALGERRHRR